VIDKCAPRMSEQGRYGSYTSMPIRPYSEEDFAELLRMSLALFPDATAQEHERDLRAILAREDAAVFIALRDNGTPAGFVEVGTRPYVDGCDTSPVGFIEAWYVDPDVRRTGIGGALLRAAEDWARARGYTEMGSDALLDNVLSHRAHEANGYMEVERAVRFRKVL
jgi:aminoglycoside 6'-N-acetyltransferase I